MPGVPLGRWSDHKASQVFEMCLTVSSTKKSTSLRITNISFRSPNSGFQTTAACVGVERVTQWGCNTAAPGDEEGGAAESEEERRQITAPLPSQSAAVRRKFGGEM